MSEAHDKKNTTQEFIRSYLPLIVAIVSIAVAWGGFSQRIAFGEQRQDSIETRQLTVEKSVNDLNNSITRLNTILDERFPSKYKK